MKLSRIPFRTVGVVLALSMLGSCGGGGSSGFALPPATSAQPVPAEITQIFQKPAYRNALWALRVIDADSGRLIHDFNSGRPILIGSVRKLFSVALALETLGPGHVFRTPVYSRGSVDAAGVLHGDLIMVASGDLAMGGRTNPDGSFAISNQDHNEANALGNATLTAPNPLAGFDQLAAQVAASGIRQIAGEVIIDDRLFEHFNFRDEFKVSPIFVNDDVVDVIIDKQAGLDWRPKSAAFGVQSSLAVGAAGSALDLHLDPELPLCIGAASCTGRVAGTLPADFVAPLTGTFPLIRTFRITQPSNYARTVFIEALSRAGVGVAAAAVAPNPVRALPTRDSYAGARRVAELVSHPYKDFAKYILKVSYNLGADTSLMLFGLAQGVTTLAASQVAESATLATQFGIPADALHFVDGSGGGYTTATNEAVTTLLARMRQRASFPEFLDANPRLGIDGSLSFVTDFEKDPTLAGAKGQVHAKTGTFVDGSAQGPVLKAQSLAGYIDTKSGRRLAFTLAVNDVGVISGVNEILPVFQDVGTISALLWKLH